MTRTRWWMAAAAATVLVATATPAHAGIAHDRMVGKDPAAHTPVVEDGKGVFAIAKVADITVVGGSFTKVHERGGPTITRTNLLAFDSAGRISTTFTLAANTRVNDIVPAGDGQHVFIGGQFTSLSGLPRTNRLAKVNVFTGQVVSTFRPPTIGGKVMDLQVANGRLYVGGYFTTVAGQPHTALAALDPTTGALTDHLDLTFADIFGVSTRPMPPSGNSGLGVEHLEITPDGSRMVAIGNFRTVQGQSRVQVAMIDTSGPVATLTDWSTTRFAMTCSSSWPIYTMGLDISPDGRYFVIGTGGAYNGGPTSGTLCDTVSRWELGPTGPNQQPTWIDYMGGDSTTAIHITGAAVYAGGHFRWVNNPFAADKVGPGTVKRGGLAALDPRNGLPFSLNATKLPLRYGVLDFESTSEGLWIGHDGDSLTGQPTGRFGLLPLVTGKTLPPDNTGSLPGTAYLIGGTGQVQSSDLTETAASALAPAVDGGITWAGVRGAFMADGRLYNGWSNGTFTWRPFNGTTYGSVRTINLNGLTAFATELASIRAMWFDATDGRLYFTLSGQNALYYRYFTPESTVVGAIRHVVADPGSGISWSQVTGALLAHGKIFYSTSDGSLRSATWQRGPVVGSSSTLSGPGVDGQNWGSGVLFLRAR